MAIDFADSLRVSCDENEIHRFPDNADGVLDSLIDYLWMIWDKTPSATVAPV